MSDRNNETSLDSSIITGVILAILIIFIVGFVARKLIMMCLKMRRDNLAEEALEKREEQCAALAAAEVGGIVKMKDHVEDTPNPQCLNCNMIQMGSSISYADGSCPQCGRNT